MDTLSRPHFEIVGDRIYCRHKSKESGCQPPRLLDGSDQVRMKRSTLVCLTETANARTKLNSWNIVAGNFVFRYRNVLFAAVFILAALIFRPKVLFNSSFADRLLRAAGVVIALLGQAVRLTTIGFEYIHRGGKDGRVYAGRLIQGGLFALVRNPMYIGNALIATGMTMYLGSPFGYFVLIPLFLFVYQALIAAEEAYLHERFGKEYDRYCANVNRFVPRLKKIPEAFAGTCFDWRRSLKKDLGTITGLTIGLILIPVWRSYFLHGWSAVEDAAGNALRLTLAITAIYLFLLRLKKTNQLFRNSAQH
jgi:protein-S-isoprenylcysteine O-methyltransferase Ste14